MDILLSGQITALAPITISRPGQDERLVGVPLTTRIQSNGRTALVPQIPGETIRGRLRRLSVRLLHDAILAHSPGSKAIDIHAYNWLAIGGIKGSAPQEAEDLLKLAQERNKNPLISLYGAAAPRWVPGRLRVDHAVADNVAPIDRSRPEGIYLTESFRSDDLERDPDLQSQFDTEDLLTWMRRRDVEGERSETKALITSLKQEAKQIRTGKGSKAKPADPDARLAEIAAEIETLEAQVKAHKGGTSKAPIVRRGIAPGTRMPHKFSVRYATEAEVGLFLETLRAWSDDLRIGGLGAVGHGEIEAVYNIRIRAQANQPFEDAGELRLEDGSFALPAEPHPLITRALKAWEALASNPDAMTVRPDDRD